MSSPPLLHYETVREYKTHYEKHYCRSPVYTYDGMRVYFSAHKFGHAFYENSLGQKGPKDVFSHMRAQRMDWIKLTLEHPEADHYVGWNKAARSYEKSRRVSVVYEDFVVVLQLGLNKAGQLKANFVTCYVADRSINQIRGAPKWDRDKCLEILEKKSRR